VVLPIVARLAQPGEPLALKAALRYLTCKEICIPYETVLQLALPAGASTLSDHAELIARYAAQVPSAATAPGLPLASARIVAGVAPTLTFSIRAATPLAAPDIFIEGPAGLSFGAPAVALARDRLSAVLTVPFGGDKDAARTLATATLRATLVDGARALETQA